MFVPVRQWKCICWRLIRTVMVLGGAGLWEVIGSCGGAHMNGASTLIEEVPENSLVPSPCEHAERRQLPVNQVLPGAQPATPWSWTSQPADCEKQMSDTQSIAFCYSRLNRPTGLRTVITLQHVAPFILVFPAVMYAYESWTIKKAECRRIDAFQLWCWRRLLRVPWTARRSNQFILKEISPKYSLEGLALKLKLQ